MRFQSSVSNALPAVPNGDVQSVRVTDVVLQAEVDDVGSRFFKFGAGGGHGHEEDAGAGDACRFGGLPDFFPVAFMGDDEFEPCVSRGGESR